MRFSSQQRYLPLWGPARKVSLLSLANNQTRIVRNMLTLIQLTLSAVGLSFEVADHKADVAQGQSLLEEIEPSCT